MAILDGSTPEELKREYEERKAKNEQEECDNEIYYEDQEAEELKITDICGSFIKDASDEIFSYIEASPTTILNLMLVMMSTVIGSRAVTFNIPMREVRLNLWTIILGATAVTAKSTTAETTHDLVLDGLSQMLSTMFQTEKEEYSKLKPEEKANIPEPRLKNIKVGQSSTFQGVILALNKNQHGLLYYVDEALSVLEKMNKSGELKADLTSIYSEKELNKVKVGSDGKGEDISIIRPFLSIVMLSTQEWFYNKIKKDAFISGHFARFTIFEIEDPVPRKSKNRKKQDFSKFQNVSKRIWNYFSNFSNLAPLEVELTDEAFDRVVEWDEKTSYIDDESAYYEFLDAESYNGSLARIKNKVFKYALIIQIFDSFYEGKVFNENDKVSLKYINIAIKIAENDILNIKKVLKRYKDNTDNTYTKHGPEVEDEAALKIKDYLARENINQSKLAIPPAEVIKNNTYLKANRSAATRVLNIAIQKYGVLFEIRDYRGQNKNYYYYQSYTANENTYEVEDDGINL